MRSYMSKKGHPSHDFKGKKNVIVVSRWEGIGWFHPVVPSHTEWGLWRKSVIFISCEVSVLECNPFPLIWAVWEGWLIYVNNYFVGYVCMYIYIYEIPVRIYKSPCAYVWTILNMFKYPLVMVDQTIKLLCFFVMGLTSNPLNPNGMFAATFLLQRYQHPGHPPSVRAATAALPPAPQQGAWRGNRWRNLHIFQRGISPHHSTSMYFRTNGSIYTHTH